jgi:hypothetical protein
VGSLAEEKMHSEYSGLLQSPQGHLGREHGCVQGRARVTILILILLD